MRLLLIEDDKREWEKFKNIAHKRTDIEFVGMTDSADEGLSLVKRKMPDGIILDLELNEGKGSGFTFLEEIKKLKLDIYPKIVVTTNVYSDSVYDYLHECKVDFIFYKKQDTYSVEGVINTLALLSSYKNKPKNDAKDESSSDDEDTTKIMSEKVNKELDLIGISTRLQGRKYLYDAIMYLLSKESENEKISINQYLVSKYKRVSSTISRAMQNAIIHAWRVTAPDDLENYYTAKVSYETGIPTPVELIYYYVDKIKKEL